MFLRFLLSRLGLALLSLWGVSVLVFAILRILPGDPRSSARGLDRRGHGARPAGVRPDGVLVGRVRRVLPEPLPGQLRSLALAPAGRAPVIVERLPATLELAVTALFLATGGGVLLGAFSVWRRRSWLESGAVSLGTLGIAVPNFVRGLLLIVVFGALLQILPISAASRRSTRRR